LFVGEFVRQFVLRLHGNQRNILVTVTPPHSVGRDSAVGIATCYELDGSGIESRWRRIFRARPDRPWGPPSLLYNGYWVSFPGVKRPRRGLNHPPLSSAGVEERVELYLHSPSGPSWCILGRTLPLPLPPGGISKWECDSCFRWSNCVDCSTR
jgi:hypothetical protein